MKERHVEKLTPDMVGMETKLDEYWLEIMFVGNNIAVIGCRSGLEHSVSVHSSRFIRDPKEKEKLPSERLNEFFSPCPASFDKALIDILDELWMRTEK